MTRFFLSTLLLLSMAGCGYTTGSLLPTNYKKIAIEPFENKSNQPWREKTGSRTGKRAEKPAMAFVRR